ncbi:hypothetical protein LCGC14_0579220 [marine sediment metagenome]|uniref:Uncharacterized protein n=1 Tax=marine sediment metagenome TaxID=412755 RepID=A0A0F9UQ24_9ZZZZ
MNLTNKQRNIFKRIWFIYGNGGRKHTPLNHKLIQGFLEHNEDRMEDYRNGYDNLLKRFNKKIAKEHGVTPECFEVCDLILSNNIEQAIKKAIQ